MKQAIILILMLFSIITWGCDDNYFSDGGILDPNVGNLNLSTLEYLEKHPEKFDTLARLIRICGLENEVNRSGNTFFAPHDYSIHNYFRLLYADSPWPVLGELPAEVVADITTHLKNYIITGQQIVREELSPAYSYSTTLGGKKARFNLIREDYLDNVNKGASYIIFSVDVNQNPERSEVYQSAQVRVSNLRSTNGVVHELVPDSHIFGFK